MLRRLLILSCLVATAPSCIPMKHPNPGIPATPKPEKCPAYPASPPAECAAVFCNAVPPMITAEKVTCPDRVCLYYKNVFGTTAIVYCARAVVVCTDDGWYATAADGVTLGMKIGGTENDSPKWGCRPGA